MSQLDYGQRPQQPAKSRLMVMVLLVTILCLVSFVIGIMVGKGGQGSEVETTSITQTSPIPSKPEVQEVVKQEIPAEQLLGDKAAAPESADPVVQTAADTSEADAADPLRDLLPPVEQMPLGSGINQGVTSQPVEVKAGPVGATIAPASAPAVKVAPAAVPVVSAPKSAPVVTAEPVRSGYVVQVASFKKQADAVNVQEKLLTHFPAQVQKVDLGGKGVWFRVLVGPVESASAANSLKQRLKEKMKMDGFVKKISQ